MEIIDALKLIATRSPAALQNAMQAIAAVRARSPIIQTRYLRTLELALADEDAEFSEAEKAGLISLVELSDGQEIQETKTHTLRIRISESERAYLENLASAAGQTMSEYARQKIFGS